MRHSDTTQAEKPPVQESTLGEHDEPIVVDNAPLGIRLRKDIPKRGNGYAWVRDFDKFHMLVVIPRESNHDPKGGEYIVKRLDPKSKIVFVMAPANDHKGTEEQLVFTKDPNKRELAMTPAREWSIHTKSGRLMPKASPKLRLKRIEYTELGSREDHIDLVGSDDYKHNNVEVLIIGLHA